jgi:hypothetical protein
MAGCCEGGDELSGSGATEVVILPLEVARPLCFQMFCEFNPLKLKLV